MNKEEPAADAAAVRFPPNREERRGSGGVEESAAC